MCPAQPVVADLSRMPHLLIAGTTGSGKSVCIASLTTCLVMNNSPEDMRLVMIDPKMVELVRFNGIPHLIGKVETDLERIAAYCAGWWQRCKIVISCWRNCAQGILRASTAKHFAARKSNHCPGSW